MGYAKFFEDNERITTDRKYELELFYSNINNVIYYDCYYCDKSFESLEKRVKQNNSSLNIEIVGILDSAINKDNKDNLCAEAIEIIKSLRAII